MSEQSMERKEDLVQATAEPAEPPSRSSGHSGILRRIGWMENEHGEQVFRAFVDYPNGPPSGLPFSVVWNQTPVQIVVVARSTDDGTSGRANTGGSLNQP